MKTLFFKKPIRSEWSAEIKIPLRTEDKHSECYYFERLRSVGDIPVMHEKNWFSAKALPGFLEAEFVEGSFFKTLSTKYFIEVIGSTSELRAEFANKKLSAMLNLEEGAPVLHISVQFHTSNPRLTIYGELYCNTQNFPIGSSYFMQAAKI